MVRKTRFSRTFQCQAVGFDGADFLNLVAEIQTEQSLPELISYLKQLENDLGRLRSDEKFSSRQIDIDILLFGDKTYNTPIVLPRGEIRGNAYVLWPLSELAPDLIEPGGTKSHAELWGEFNLSSQIIRVVE